MEWMIARKKERKTRPRYQINKSLLYFRRSSPSYSSRYCWKSLLSIARTSSSPTCLQLNHALRWHILFSGRLNIVSRSTRLVSSSLRPPINRNWTIGFAMFTDSVCRRRVNRWWETLFENSNVTSNERTRCVNWAIYNWNRLPVRKCVHSSPSKSINGRRISKPITSISFGTNATCVRWPTIENSRIPRIFSPKRVQRPKQRYIN